MTDSWSNEIHSAQAQTYYVINNKKYERRPWFGPGKCPDCAVAFSQLHVPGCDKEKCPACGSQAISCDCDYLEDTT